jgi:hypothetical protein
MRRLARWDDLPTESHPLIDAMVEKRLLVNDTRDGQTVVEVALESLLRQWRELAAWLRDEAQDLKDADTLERAAAASGVGGHSSRTRSPGPGAVSGARQRPRRPIPPMHRLRTRTGRASSAERRLQRRTDNTCSGKPQSSLSGGTPGKWRRSWRFA